MVEAGVSLIPIKETGVVGDKGDRHRKENVGNVQGEWRYSTLTIAKYTVNIRMQNRMRKL